MLALDSRSILSVDTLDNAEPASTLRHSRRSRLRKHLLLIVSYLGRASDRAEKTSKGTKAIQEDRKMAFDGRSGEPHILDTHNNPGMTNFWYKPNETDLLVRQGVWEEGNMGFKPPNSYALPEMAGQQHAGLLYVAKQHWDSKNPWAPTQSLLTRFPSLNMPVEGCAYTVPGLLSHTTSRRSSLNPPFTPDTAGNVSTPTRSSFASLGDAVFSNERFVSLGDQTETQGPFDPEIIADQSLGELESLTPTYPSNDLDIPMMADVWLDRVQEQAWGKSVSTMSQLSLQQAVTSPPHWPAFEKRSSQRKNTLTGTWQMNDDFTWTLCDEDVSTLDASDDTGCAFGPATPTRYQEDDFMNALNDLDNIAPHIRIESATKEKYPLVQCEQCGKAYTGRYGTGNMQRHVRLKHASELQKEYICIVCKKAFNRSDALLNHERQKHPTLRRASAMKRPAS